MKFGKAISASLYRVLTTVVVLTASSAVMRAADMKSEDVVAKHLDSIGTAEVRAAAKSRVVQGTSLFKIRIGGGGRTHRKECHGFLKDGSPS
jgi:hypothetical protein